MDNNDEIEEQKVMIKQGASVRKYIRGMKVVEQL